MAAPFGLAEIAGTTPSGDACRDARSNRIHGKERLCSLSFYDYCRWRMWKGDVVAGFSDGKKIPTISTRVDRPSSDLARELVLNWFNTVSGISRLASLPSDSVSFVGCHCVPRIVARPPGTPPDVGLQSRRVDRRNLDSGSSPVEVLIFLLVVASDTRRALFAVRPHRNPSLVGRRPRHLGPGSANQLRIPGFVSIIVKRRFTVRYCLVYMYNNFARLESSDAGPITRTVTG